MLKHESVVDPAAEVEYLKALEKAELNRAVWPAPVKTKPKMWPAAPDIAKLKAARPQVWRPMMDDAEFAQWQPGGLSRSEIIRGLIAVAGMLLFILLTEVK